MNPKITYSLLFCTSVFASYQTHRIRKIKETVNKPTYKSFEAAFWDDHVDFLSQQMIVDYNFYNANDDVTKTITVNHRDTVTMDESSKKFYTDIDERYVADTKLGLVQAQIRNM